MSDKQQSTGQVAAERLFVAGNDTEGTRKYGAELKAWAAAIIDRIVAERPCPECAATKAKLQEFREQLMENQRSWERSGYTGEAAEDLEILELLHKFGLAPKGGGGKCL